VIRDYNCNLSEHTELDTVLGFTGRVDGMTGSPTLATVDHNAALEQKITISTVIAYWDDTANVSA
jgi:hypothetical protein